MNGDSRANSKLGGGESGMSYLLRKPLTINMDEFAQDFADFLAAREGRKQSRIELIVVADEKWDQLLAVTKPYLLDPTNNDLRVGMVFAITEPMTEKEVPDLVKTLFPELGDAMQSGNVIICFNQQTMTHPQETDPERAFNAVFNNLVILTEKALALHGYGILNPIVDSQEFHESPYFRADRWVDFGSST
jgi:hypothetical protein